MKLLALFGVMLLSVVGTTQVTAAEHQAAAADVEEDAVVEEGEEGEGSADALESEPSEEVE